MWWVALDRLKLALAVMDGKLDVEVVHLNKVLVRMLAVKWQ